MSFGDMAPWRARALSKASKEAKYRAVLDLNAERVLIGRQNMIGAYAIGAVGILCIIGSAGLVVSVLPLKKTVPIFYAVDRSTGIIDQPVGVIDAPDTFTEAVDQMYLRRYVEAYEGWLLQTDQRSDHLIKIMSTPDQQARYMARRAAPDHPSKLLGKDGVVQVEPHFRFHRHPGGSAHTRSYDVFFEITSWRGNQKVATKSYTATVDFQWHPELDMAPDDRSLNPGGMQVIAYAAQPDIPEGK